MANFIEEFFYGNIDPQARSTKQNKAVQKQMEILMTNEDLLTTALTDENKKMFLDTPSFCYFLFQFAICFNKTDF